MNFIKTSKFSVKGIDTTRYISNEVRNLLFNRKGQKSPFPTDTKCRPEHSEGSPPFPGKDLKFFLGRVRGVFVHLLDLKRRPLTAFGVTIYWKGGKAPFPTFPKTL